MSAVQVLVSGCLFKAPEERTSQAGRRFVSATIKVGGDSGTGEFWACLAFSDSTQAELLRLGVGDALSAQGSAKFELYQNGGEVRISRTIFANAILPLRAAPRERRSKQAKAETPLLDQPAPQRPTAPPDDLNDDLDDLPF